MKIIQSHPCVFDLTASQPYPLKSQRKRFDYRIAEDDSENDESRPDKEQADRPPALLEGYDRGHRLALALYYGWA
jgi:hypothetical protein